MFHVIPGGLWVPFTCIDTNLYKKVPTQPVFSQNLFFISLQNMLFLPTQYFFIKNWGIGNCYDADEVCMIRLRIQRVHLYARAFARCAIRPYQLISYQLWVYAMDMQVSIYLTATQSQDNGRNGLKQAKCVGGPFHWRYFPSPKNLWTFQLSLANVRTVISAKGCTWY